MSSKELFELAAKLFPMGVNSPVRYFKDYPFYVKEGKGSTILDVDGNKYIDYCLGYGPLILGHSDPDVTRAVIEQAEKGLLFGEPSENEIKLAEMIKETSKNIEMMRFTNSGTEATMHAIRLARAITGRKLIVKMEGGFHGAHDYSLIKSGSGTLTFGSPSSPGIPDEVAQTVIVGKYNDENNIKEIFQKYGDKIAAVITEPIMGNAGVILPKQGFLEFLRDITQKHGSLLIFDEVITGYRFAFSPFQDIMRIDPDITTMGKIIGGGLPIGLFGGSEEIMKNISPSGNVYEAGTFSGNPMSMAAGYAAMEKLSKQDYSILKKRTQKLVSGIDDILDRKHITHTIKYYGTMFQVFFADHVNNYDDALKARKEVYFKLFKALSKNGVYLPPSQYETNFVSFAHSDSDIDATLAAFEKAVAEMD
ncbi:glutamate-1-semialdehyde 2,1-aminomutase [Thermoplasma volcanium GSS1]|uniref:Glutamate-1-semialdehyde 2,1-aminomutase n=1 Tax=Thermoplasma volcanium (strain ATCC 51530 / DSM 4299 / JCM 9571 / NBRC 15438 / GSS1) TaxID=273116 RepID=GSA_THEVO|nr:glutamate-1-semialdehyde 2,1-aminomutase [Thermoplasma volcanium]Q97B25.1 RecName: Full=Glutamate-1-semialdehyde 2,1-aminomutase; Short=GSA; AltName: Full=Glutamate-1-semialdehyde aminotransferase; Short=GSA-AT [Thermoplasma volcanium GSS1]BAB59776.1 glutamate-1-semialdehyde 2,1-aminomutase [Thermoplasma volcanium GSS1]